jgi:peptidoglycan-associated lipoprotein
MRKLSLAVLLACLAGCPGKPKYPACDGDKECQKGEKCVNKHCQQCATDADCGDGKQCVKGACQAIPGYCTADGDCPNGQVCKEHKCEACVADSECGEGGRCREGGCLRKGQCDADADCAEDEDCINHVCIKGGAGGAADGDRPTCTLETIYFGFDQYVLTEDSKQALERNLTCMSSSPRGVSVIGHTDSRGTIEYNIGLSDDRAQSVVTYLSRLGIDMARLHKVPRGATEASGSDEAGYAKDRRVEFQWE